MRCCSVTAKSSGKRQPRLLPAILCFFPGAGSPATGFAKVSATGLSSTVAPSASGSSPRRFSGAVVLAFGTGSGTGSGSGSGGRDTVSTPSLLRRDTIETKDLSNGFGVMKGDCDRLTVIFVALSEWIRQSWTIRRWSWSRSIHPTSIRLAISSPGLPSQSIQRSMSRSLYLPMFPCGV